MMASLVGGWRIVKARNGMKKTWCRTKKFRVFRENKALCVMSDFIILTNQTKLLAFPYNSLLCFFSYSLYTKHCLRLSYDSFPFNH